MFKIIRQAIKDWQKNRPPKEIKNKELSPMQQMKKALEKAERNIVTVYSPEPSRNKGVVGFLWHNLFKND